jgi:hypothetical protein
LEEAGPESQVRALAGQPEAIEAANRRLKSATPKAAKLRID